MDYELALELKNAGFPFVVYRYHEKAKHPFIIRNTTEFNGVTYYLPNLTELIEACPKTIHSTDSADHVGRFALLYDEENWRAGYNAIIPYEGDYLTKENKGPTPEEAVARLWLALHTK